MSSDAGRDAPLTRRCAWERVWHRPCLVECYNPVVTIRTAQGDTLDVRPGQSWEAFEAYLAERGERSRPRVSYLEGTLQIMSPSGNHEIIKERLAALIVAFLDHTGTRYDGIGAWLLKDARRRVGLEPDACYILGELGKTRPDLAIEVVWTSGGVNKLAIYERLGVPEVWFWKDDVVSVYVLTAAGYKQQSSSDQIPDFPFEIIPELLELQALSDVHRVLRKRFPAR